MPPVATEAAPFEKAAHWSLSPRVSISVTCRPLEKSHTLACPFELDPSASSSPPEEKTVARYDATGSAGEVMVRGNASQILTTPSSSPVARRDPSLDHATASTSEP